MLLLMEVRSDLQTVYLDQIKKHLGKVRKEAVQLIEDTSTSAKTRMKRDEIDMELQVWQEMYDIRRRYLINNILRVLEIKDGNS